MSDNTEFNNEITVVYLNNNKIYGTKQFSIYTKFSEIIGHFDKINEKLGLKYNKNFVVSNLVVDGKKQIIEYLQRLNLDKKFDKMKKLEFYVYISEEKDKIDYTDLMSKIIYPIVPPLTNNLTLFVYTPKEGIILIE